jgi:hypothetical protein
MKTIDPLLPDAGADFFGVIDRTREGRWRVVAVSRKSAGKTSEDTFVADEFTGIETFQSEEAAYHWLKQQAIARGFRNIQITTRIGKI